LGMGGVNQTEVQGVPQRQHRRFWTISDRNCARAVAFLALVSHLISASSELTGTYP
jgi:hypothetical protein